MNTEVPRGPVDVLVTGASGFIGAALVDRLAGLGMTVQATDLKAGRHATVRLDVTDGAEVVEVLQRLKPRAVVHAAAIVDDRVSQDRCQRVNVGGTENLLDAAALVGVERFVHISSIAAVGIDPGEGVDEETPLVFDTGSPYFDTKAASEELVRQVQARDGAMPCVIVRPGDVFGPGSEPWVERPVAMMRKKIPLLIQRGEGLIAHCWIDNLIDGLVLAVEHDDAPGGVFQITDGVDTTTFRDYLARLADAAGMAPPKVSLPRGLALAMGAAFERYQRLSGKSAPFTRAAIRYICRHATYSLAASRDVLGYAPRVGLEEGFERLRAGFARESHASK